MAARHLIRKQAKTITAGPIAVDLSGLCATVNGKDLFLTRTEFELLAYFVQNPRRVLTRSELLQAASHSAFMPSERAVDAHVKNLRSKLAGVCGCSGYIRTVYGSGYRLVTEP